MALSKTCLRLIAICSFYVLYLVIGASILSTIEGPEEREKVKSLKAIRSSFLQDNHECISGNLIIIILILNSKQLDMFRILSDII